MGLPTINDVARLAGVSKKTVSRVINRSALLRADTRAKVEGAIAELGFVPSPQARALALGRNFIVAMIHDASGAALASQAQQGALAALRDSEFALCVFAVELASPFLLADLRRFLELHRPYGVILLPTVAHLPGIIELCAELGTSTVQLAGSAPGDESACVWSADRQAAADLTQYLVALGHQRIGFIAGPADCLISRECELGYMDALAVHGLDRGADLVASGEGNAARAKAAAHLLLEVSPRPTAIFAAGDEMAAGVFEAALALGVAVPHQLSVAGFGDAPFAAMMAPALTSVRRPLTEMAFAAAIRLADPVAGANQPAEFRPELVTRGSTGPAA
jgi:LacI family transcriptional regulator